MGTANAPCSLGRFAAAEVHPPQPARAAPSPTSSWWRPLAQFGATLSIALGALGNPSASTSWRALTLQLAALMLSR